MSFNDKVKRNILDNGLLLEIRDDIPNIILWANDPIFESMGLTLNLHLKALLLQLRICFHFFSIHLFLRKKRFLFYQYGYNIKPKTSGY